MQTSYLATLYSISYAQNPLHTFPRRQLVTATGNGAMVPLHYCAANIGFLNSQHSAAMQYIGGGPRLSDTSTDNLFLPAFYKHKVKEKARFLPFLASNHELLDTAIFSVSVQAVAFAHSLGPNLPK